MSETPQTKTTVFLGFSWTFIGQFIGCDFLLREKKIILLCFCAWSERNGLSVKLFKMRYNYIVLMRYKEEKKINDEDEERAEYKSKAFSAPADLHPQPHLRSQALKEWDLGYKRWSFLRGGAGLSLREGVQSSVIQEELKVELLHSKKSRLRWFWHLPRMPSFRRGVLDMSHWEESPVQTLDMMASLQPLNGPGTPVWVGGDGWKAGSLGFQISGRKWKDGWTDEWMDVCLQLVTTSYLL